MIACRLVRGIVLSLESIETYLPLVGFLVPSTILFFSLPQPLMVDGHLNLTPNKPRASSIYRKLIPLATVAISKTATKFSK
jgi:hypothetical protein